MQIYCANEFFKRYTTSLRSSYAGVDIELDFEDYMWFKYDVYVQNEYENRIAKLAARTATYNLVNSLDSYINSLTSFD